MKNEDKKKKGAVAKTTKASLPAKRNYGEYAGMGQENLDRDDFKIPFLSLLQSLSPEVQKDDPRFIKEAEVGMFINSVTKELFSGADGLILVPCYREHHFVEWQPRREGGGFVTTHATDSQLVKDAKAAAASFKDVKTKTGNELQDTFMLYCLRLDAVNDDEPVEVVVLSCSKTKIKRYREYMTRIGTIKGAKDNPLFAHMFKLTSTRENGAEGPYQNVQLDPVIDDDVLASMPDPEKRAALMEAGAGLYRAVKAGAKKADYENADAEPSPGDDVVFG